MPANQPRFGKNEIDDLQRRVIALEKTIRLLNTRRPHMPLMDMSAQGTPFAQDGAVLIDYTASPKDLTTASHSAKYSFGGKWHNFNPHQYEIKITADDTVAVVGDGAFIFVVPADINNHKLLSAEAYVTSSPAGVTTVSLYNLTDSVDMLSTSITIDAAEYSSYTGATRSVVNTTTNVVNTGDRISVNVDTTSTGKGLGLILVFS